MIYRVIEKARYSNFTGSGKVKVKNLKTGDKRRMSVMIDLFKKLKVGQLVDVGGCEMKPLNGLEILMIR